MTSVSKHWSTCADLQYLSLASNTTGVYSDAINCNATKFDIMGPGMYSIAGSEVSIFGGFTISRTVLKTCLQQTASESRIGSKWTCLSSSESTLEGLGTVEGDYYTGNLLQYSNFFLKSNF